MGLQGRDRESVRRFSKGMYQRLGLAQALMHDPDLLVLDEPTDGLDPVGRTEVRKVIERLRDSGKTIFLNSHILQEVEMVCTRVAILANGEICGSGTHRRIVVAGTSGAGRRLKLPCPSESDGQSVDLRMLFAAQRASDVEVTAVDAEGRTHRISARLPEQAAGGRMQLIDCDPPASRSCGWKSNGRRSKTRS